MIRKGNTGGRRLTFKNIRCPLCQGIMGHPSIDAIVTPQYNMYQKVRRKALQRWVVEQRRPLPRPNDPADEDKIATLAMTKMTFFECSQCNEPYYGGEVECGDVEEEEDLDDDVQAALAMELVCRGCASKGQLQCPEHGTEFLGWKCRYCCEREAHYFCFGTTHFCYVWLVNRALAKTAASSAGAIHLAAETVATSTRSVAPFVHRTRSMASWSPGKRARSLEGASETPRIAPSCDNILPCKAPCHLLKI
jgi:hypothetical protein